jgi:hypothetical protein
VRIQAVLHADQPAQVGPARWRRNRALAERRELAIRIGDLLLVLAEPTAASLQQMLSAIVLANDDAGRPASWAGGPNTAARARRSTGVRIQVTAGVWRPGDVGRPRWEDHGRELVVAMGDLLLVFSRSAAWRLLENLSDALASLHGSPRSAGESR